MRVFGCQMLAKLRSRGGEVTHCHGNESLTGRGYADHSLH